MSFFGFEQQNDLENEKRKFLEGGLSGAQEDVAVYTWGEDSYDGLGDALQEGGDELNDETFGLSGPVGKDFDFSGTALPEHQKPASSQLSQPQVPQAHTRSHEQIASQTPQKTQGSSELESSHSSHLDAVWSNKSPFSVLPRSNGPSRAHDQHAAPGTKHSPLVSSAQQATPVHKSTSLSLGADLHKGVHTLEEIEREMLAAAAAQQQQQQQQQLQQLQREQEFEEQLRLQQAQQQLQQLQLQQQLLQQSPQPQLATHGALQSPSRTHAQRQAPGPQHAAATPPPRMHPHSQSPRFHQQQQQHQIHLLQLQQQQQRQLLELQEQRERQQRQQLLELQEQLRLEELERQQQQHRLQQQQMQAGVNDLMQSHLIHQRLNSGGLSPAFGDRARRVGRQSPAIMTPPIPVEVPFGQNLQYLPQNIQMQQRLLAEMAQAEFLTTMQGAGLPERDTRESREVQEMLRVEAMRKIMEAERMEEKRKRKLDKIAHMSRYNDLMTQSDKDFITRIQVSQLVTQDPYADDFYAQVYGAILRSRMGLPTSEDRVLKFGSGGGVGLGLGQKVPGRRQSAMQRMEAQVERIVNNARMREKEKTSLNNLQGALGRTAGRSYKAAPRQLLQVDSSNGSTSPTVSHSHSSSAHISKADASKAQEEGEGAAREAAKIGREALGNATDATGLIRRDPLTHREALVKLEQLYDLVLDLEQRRRDQPPPEEVEEFEKWTQECSTLIDELFDKLMVIAPLETSKPHPFISLITPIKGKKLLPRVARLLDNSRMQVILTLIVACFSQLDVVIQAPLLDTLEETREVLDLETQTQAFLSSVVQSILPVIAKAQMRLVTGLFGLLLESNNILEIARTRPGIALLTLFLSRAEVILQNVATGSDVDETPTQEELQSWNMLYNHLFELLRPQLVLLFPSVRLSMLSGVNFTSVPNADVIDQPVWQFLASLACSADETQQQALVTGLRDIVLENVTTATKGIGLESEERRRLRLANVNLFLHALGLDSSQIAV
ncbi:topoisomerase II-associated protein PAT1 [Cubamyces menziesii]|nr:topoisomerase II-associated protein PAT1 [Cubamyces menziesii]